jgi:cell division protein FtsQ
VEAIERAPRARPGRARSRARIPRTLVIVAGTLLVCGLVYVAARQTSMFALRSVVVAGAPDDVARAVRDALAPLEGESLVAIDVDEIVRRVERIPTVIAATADRDFPHTLTVTVRPERPVAVVRRADGAWLVSARGRVMENVELGAFGPLPRVWLPQALAAPSPGTFLLPDQGGLLVRALARVPAGFPGKIDAARGTPGDVVLVLRSSGTELRLGEAVELRAKLVVAATVLRSLNGVERRDLAYLDLSVPTRPVGAPKPQVEASA